MEPRIGSKLKNAEEVANCLIRILADEFVLYVQIRKAHWKVERPHFFYLRMLIEEQYDRIGEVIDEVGDRIQSIGSYAPATLREYRELTHLKEQSNQAIDSNGFLKDLWTTHETIILNLRKQIVRVNRKFNDPVTSDFIDGIVATHEKMVLIIRTHVK